MIQNLSTIDDEKNVSMKISRNECQWMQVCVCATLGNMTNGKSGKNEKKKDNRKKEQESTKMIHFNSRTTITWPWKCVHLQGDDLWGKCVCQ